MVAVIDEQQQWFDEDTNTPINNGYIYIGARNGDPRTAVDIYSDRELTTALANPQRTDSAGRSVNKIWIADRYSIEVSNSNDVQKYIELDAGESASAATVTLGNVLGSNNITATGNPTITSYDDLSEYILRTVQVNTDAVTINIDDVGEIDVVKNHDQPILANDFEANQNIILTYNSTDNVMEWANQNLKNVLDTIFTNFGIISVTFPTSGPQTAVAFESVTADTSGGSFTVNLPATPAQGDFVSFSVGSDYITNNLTIGRNGETIMGEAADMIISTNNTISLRYNGSDWRVS